MRTGSVYGLRGEPAHAMLMLPAAQCGGDVAPCTLWAVVVLC